MLTVMSRNLSEAYSEYSSFRSIVMTLIADEAHNEYAEKQESFEELFIHISTNEDELLLVAINSAAPPALLFVASSS